MTATSSENDVFVYNAGGMPLTSFRSNVYGLGDRTLLVSSDGFVLAMATPFGQPPSLLIAPIGAMRPAFGGRASMAILMATPASIARGSSTIYNQD